ncbi:MAG: hypothetical protein LC657_08645, partial [Desulfobacteraceae bacterium]|nr:hypothetical protein [Desulfobacteraceae bacterium]
WLMMLPDDLTKQFAQNLIAYEEEKKMPYVTSTERIGIEKSRDEGMLFNAREMVLEALDEKFSRDIPTDIHDQIKALNNRMLLKRLLRSAIQSKDIDDFRKTMKDLASETESAE